MALNLSTLTSPTTSGDVLSELTTKADFLDQVPVLRNIARGPNKGGDATQTTGLNQPKALPYDGKGYLYLSGVSGNYADVPVFDIGALDDFTIQIDGLDAGSVRPAATVTPISYFGVANTNRSFILQISTTGQIKLYLYLNGVTGHTYNDSTAVPTNTIGIRITRVGTVLTYWVDSGSGYVSHDTDTIATTPLYNPVAAVSVNVGQYSGGDRLTGKISRAVIWDNGTQAGTPVLDVDFTATNIPHGAKKFQCATGQTVTINQSGNDPATIIKRSVLRFNGSTSGLSGLFNQTITGGHFFAAFSVLGDGGDEYARIFSGNSTGSFDYDPNGFTIRRNVATDQVNTRWNGASEITHSDVFNGARGDFLLESPLKAGNQNSKINNADADDGASSLPDAIDSEEFNICEYTAGGRNAAIDLYWLGLFPATLSPAEAARVVSWVNRRSIFDLKDGFGHYFYDGTKAPVGNITNVATWNGRIVGSDNGDVDKLGSQPTNTAQPVGDGYKVTFATTDFVTIPSTTQSGWQICGTSLGTFVYRVNGTTTVTELNLLGNLGNASFRQAGDLYGIILLPETATGADIEAARQVLINRGAADKASSTNISNYFRGRADIVEFNYVNLDSVTTASQLFGSSANIQRFNVPSMPNAVVLNSAWENNDLRSFTTQLPKATQVSYAWYSNSNLESFSVDLPEATSLSQAWYNCSSLSDFGTTEIPKGANFSNAWQGCTALTSFPAGAKLGTAAENVNFTSAWQGSGLTSFSTPLPTGRILSNAFLDSALENFNLTSLPEATSIAYTFRNIDITEFNTSIPKASLMLDTWRFCDQLVDFSADVFANWNPPSIHDTAMFLRTWSGCTALSSKSVENILVGISNANVWPTLDAQQGGTPISNPQIDIDYDGTALSAATNTAIASLRDTKGWSIFINGAEQTA